MVNLIQAKLISTQEMKSGIQESKKSLKEIEVKDGKKKLALALSALGVAGIATVSIASMLKKGKLPSALSIDDFKKIGNFEKGKAFVKGKPYTGTINVINSKGKFNLQYVNGVLESSTNVEKSLKKVYSEANGIKKIETYFQNHLNDCEWELYSKTTIGRNKIVQERKNTFLNIDLKKIAEKKEDGTWNIIAEKPRFKRGGTFVDTVDVKNGQVINSKLVSTLRKPKKGKGGVLRKTIKEVNEAGNKITKTFKNNSLYSTSETVLNQDGSKRIIIKYPSKKGQDIIDIAKDGTRTILEKAIDSFDI